MSALEIARMLVLSTGHISPKTADQLPRGHMDMVEDVSTGASDVPSWGPTFARDEGWLFYVPPDKDAFEEQFEDAPKDLKDVLAFARMNECVWCMLDCDGPVVDGLYHYNWGE